MLGVPPADLSRKNRDWLRDLLVFSGFFFALTAFTYFYTLRGGAPIPRDSTTLNVGRDYLNFWMYGSAALSADPSRFYDHILYNQELGRLFGLGDLGVNWSYPPSIMLLAVPFALIAYMPSLLLWTILSLAIFAVTMDRFIADRRIVVALLFSPAAAFCLMSGQSSFVTTAVLAGIFAFLDRRPLLAGFLIGLLTLKPQLGILFPVMLIASGRWRVFGAAAVTAVAIAAATALIFGAQVWVDFVKVGLPTQNLVLSDPVMRVAPFMPTIFMNMRQIGADYATAMAAQLCFSAAAAAAVFWAYRFRKTADPHMLAGLFLACTVAASPYMLAYDVLPLTVAAVMLVAAGRLDAKGRRIAQLVYWLPVLQVGFGSLHVPGPALIPAIFAGYLIVRLRAPVLSETQSAESGNLALGVR
jgi:hypothetical protein